MTGDVEWCRQRTARLHPTDRRWCFLPAEQWMRVLNFEGRGCSAVCVPVSISGNSVGVFHVTAAELALAGRISPT